MSSGGVADNIPDLPSTIGSGWLQVSVDDPARDKKVIINNLMRELCIADEQERQHGKFAELTIEDVWTLKAFDSNYVKKFLKAFGAEEQVHRNGINRTDTSYRLG